MTISMSVTTTPSRRVQEPELVVDTPVAEGALQSGPWQAEPTRPVIERVGPSRVIVHEALMTVDRPYPYMIGTEWLVAVRRADDTIDVFSLAV
jgi:hypothetical protein